MENEKRTLSIKVPADRYESGKKMAAEKDLSLSQFCRRAIEVYVFALKRQEKQRLVQRSKLTKN